MICLVMTVLIYRHSVTHPKRRVVHWSVVRKKVSHNFCWSAECVQRAQQSKSKDECFDFDVGGRKPMRGDWMPAARFGCWIC